MKILVVDDDSRIRQMTAGALRDQGHEVIEADCGAAALALLDPSIALMLTDVQMPHMTGPELAEAARARFPSLAVRFMSGDTGAIPAAAFGDCPVLAKPFTVAALLATISG